MEEDESGDEYEEAAEEEARRISNSLGCTSTSSASGQAGGGGGREDCWQQALETPTTQPPAPTGRDLCLLVPLTCQMGKFCLQIPRAD